MIRRDRNAKILATLGPAASSYEMIKKLHVSGADVFRLNFSHGTHEEHAKRYETIRKVEEELGRPIGILADMQGPKLRLGVFKDGKISIEKGQRLRLDLDDTLGDETRVQLPHPEIFKAMKAGATLLVNDGKVSLKILACTPTHMDVEVIAGTELSDRKGVNVPDVILDISPLTKKDLKDLDFALKLGCDWIALSFVQRPEDIIAAREIIGGQAKIIAKIEKPSAVENFKDILKLTDAVMVARGDLGVEMPPEELPSIQKRLVAQSRTAGKPVVVATQMLESMISSPVPTRAEASDVATAVFDGADAVMLSAESAAGDYPIESVHIMDRIITHTEKSESYHAILNAGQGTLEANRVDAISHAAYQVAKTISACVIVSFTTSGATALRAARERPAMPLLCLTGKKSTARHMALVWGVRPVHGQEISSFPEMLVKSVTLAKELGYGTTGDKIVITAGVPFGQSGSTNNLRIADIP